MSEPLDPAAPGVASVLKSLRTRTGLRVNRLHGTELDLDTLTGLDSVRALVDAGESPERAIVRAVSAAAAALDPTMSIVADVSLGLELSKDLLPDTDLYAQDLAQRRAALLRNWERLHELRSAPPAKIPSPRALRLEVESEALAALAAALTRGTSPGELPETPTAPDGARTGEPQPDAPAVTPAELAAWATGQDLPSEPKARLLDEYLTARGAIQNLVIELRSKPDRPGRLVSVPLSSPSAPTLLQTFANVAKALRGCLTRDPDGRAAGWPRDLRELSGKATPTSTAYGIKTLLLLEDGLAADLIEVAENLRKMAVPTGGYAGLEQSRPRPEVTAAVLSALRRISATETFDAHSAVMESHLGDFEKCRPFILTMMLETSLLLKPGTKLVE